MITIEIGILINGRFVCFGSTPYLKHKYGNGYKIAVKRQDNLTSDMDQIILKVSEKAVKIMSDSENYDTYQVIYCLEKNN